MDIHDENVPSKYTRILLQVLYASFDANLMPLYSSQNFVAKLPKKVLLCLATFHKYLVLAVQKTSGPRSFDV
jgi:hypothetical protein